MAWSTISLDILQLIFDAVANANFSVTIRQVCRRWHTISKYIALDFSWNCFDTLVQLSALFPGARSWKNENSIDRQLINILMRSRGDKSKARLLRESFRAPLPPDFQSAEVTLVSALSHFERLKILQLPKLITQDCISSIVSLPHMVSLEKLDMHSSHTLTDDFVANVLAKKLTGLQELSISLSISRQYLYSGTRTSDDRKYFPPTQMRGACLDALASLPYLSSLSLSYFHLLTDSQLEPLTRLISLRALVLNGCTCLTDLACRTLLTLTLLTRLGVCECQFTVDGFRVLASSPHMCAQLQHLQLDPCYIASDLTYDPDVVLLLTRLTNLTLLDMPRYFVNDTTILHLTAFKKLQRLSVLIPSLFSSGEGLRSKFYTITRLTSLSHLIVSGRVYEYDWLFLLPRLKKLSLQYSLPLPLETLQKLCVFAPALSVSFDDRDYRSIHVVTKNEIEHQIKMNKVTK